MFQTGIQAQMTMAMKYFMNPFLENDPKIGGGEGGEGNPYVKGCYYNLI